MRRAVIMLLLLFVTAWIAPPQIEDVAGQCRALQNRAMREQTLQTPAGKEDPAHATEVSRRVVEYARDRHYTWPPGLACFISYWELLQDSDLSTFQEGPSAAG